MASPMEYVSSRSLEVFQSLSIARKQGIEERQIPTLCLTLWSTEMLQDVDGNPIGAPKGSVMSNKASSSQKHRRPKAVSPNWLDPRTYWQMVGDLKLVDRSINGPCDTLCAFKPDDKVHGPKKRMNGCSIPHHEDCERWCRGVLHRNSCSESEGDPDCGCQGVEE